jgi:hypothetical protein
LCSKGIEDIKIKVMEGIIVGVGLIIVVIVMLTDKD